MKSNIFNKKTKLDRGFTLIELLVVVSIIGMLASVVLVSLQGARNKAKDAKLVLEIRELTKAMELYRLDNNGYPADGWWHSSLATCPVAAGNGGRLLTDIGTFDASFTSKYMSTFPKELVTCGIHYIGLRTTDTTALGSRCFDGTSYIDPDGSTPTIPAGQPAGQTEGQMYRYVFAVSLINDYPASPSLPKLTNFGGPANSYCILGPKW